MRAFVLMAGLLLFGAGPAATQGLAPGATPAEAIAQRKAGLREMQRQLEAMKAVLDARGDVAPLAERAGTMQAFFATFPTYFIPGSDTGDTKARPEVWSDRAGFERAAANAATAAATLQRTAATGDAAATATAFQQMGAACGACHRNYRAR